MRVRESEREGAESAPVQRNSRLAQFRELSPRHLRGSPLPVDLRRLDRAGQRGDRLLELHDVSEHAAIGGVPAVCLPPLSLSAAQKNNERGPRCLRLVLLFRRPHTACQDDSPLARTRLLACGRGLDDE